MVDVNKEKSTMEQNMRKLADDILAELRKKAHTTFDGTVDRVLPFTTKWYWDNTGKLPMRYFEIEVEVMQNHNI